MGMLNSTLLKLGSFLGNGKLYIPEYQRGYSWEEMQLDDFWIDLVQIYEENTRDEHFLGQVVIHKNKEDSKRYIIDGQQRISTAIILLDILRTKFKEIADSKNNNDANDDAEDINTRYIGRVSETKKEQYLSMGGVDKEFFIKYIQARGPINYNDKKFEKKRLKPSNYNIFYASKFFEDKISKFITKKTPNEYIELNKLYQCLINQFILMTVETDDINEAYIIFESLNARGKALETADLLKNHILRKAHNDLSSATETWNTIIDNLDNIDPTKFIRYYWNSTKKFAREKDLFKSLRKDISSQSDVNTLLSNLRSLSKVCAAILHPDDNKEFDLTELNERLLEMQKLDASSYIPIIFALRLQNYSEEDINEVLKAIETLIVRNFVVSGLVANKYELEFAQIAKSISDKTWPPNSDSSSSKMPTKDDILKKLYSLMVSDEEFINNFRIFNSKKNAVIRYLLRKINNFDINETKIVDDSNRVHVEHILPKKINDEWINFNDEDHETYLWRLGNLTLLGQEYNNRAKNKGFDKKKEIYKKSEIKMTRDLVSIDDWTTFTIVKRQEDFAEIALRIWPRN
ncbi:MAG: DUF262 domain-containing HNH endonuclease family protein [Veillonella sp.]|jgi:hypothetical protein|uniref:DUF262 domain-containing protein n=1 Tax=Veillonella sp. TaxID=1926307 RepID=UPI00290BE163|nr:DUF262 domain-containing HNH endonuclease family protein [Veillonella sp.]MDU4763079.1 DUF262 domain-containing HNH endonuclease family protein [Veillonella sp.]